MRQIVDLDLNNLNDRLFDHHMSIELTDNAKTLLTQKGFDPLLGARPLRRVIQREIEDSISEQILRGNLVDGERIMVDSEGEGLLGEFTLKGVPFSDDESKLDDVKKNCDIHSNDSSSELDDSSESSESSDSDESGESSESSGETHPESYSNEDSSTDKSNN